MIRKSDVMCPNNWKVKAHMPRYKKNKSYETSHTVLRKWSCLSITMTFKTSEMKDILQKKQGPLSSTPAAPSELCTCQPPPGRFDGPSPTQRSRRSSVSPRGQRGPSGAAPGPSVERHRKLHADPPSPAPHAHRSEPNSLRRRSDRRSYTIH